MLPKVAISRRCCSESTQIGNYRALVGSTLIDEIEEISGKLKGLRVCHINATAAGGGVAELLFRLLPIYRELGLKVDWSTIHGDVEFFKVTKAFHNALQGAVLHLDSAISNEYLEHNRLSAKQFDSSYDVYVVHDPQPAAIRAFKEDALGKWIWRCHIDSSAPNPEVWEFLRPYIQMHDASVFTLEAFRPPDLEMKRVAFIAPAIDPFSTKNMELPPDLCRRVMADSGIDLTRPLLLQVSRFDPWKDPLGVVEVYGLVKEKRPDVQLAFVGALAGDDPEGWDILKIIEEKALGDSDIHVFTNLIGYGSMEVNAFQRGADLIVQKSIKEGFGLVISEALWKGKPVVAGKAGGISMQFPEGYEDYLIDSVEDCASKLLFLMDNPKAAAAFGLAGREKIRNHFLLPRLIRDELKLIQEVLG